MPKAGAPGRRGWLRDSSIHPDEQMNATNPPPAPGGAASRPAEGWTPTRSGTQAPGLCTIWVDGKGRKPRVARVRPAVGGTRAHEPATSCTEWVLAQAALR